jgi:hypothetical protein
MNLQATSENERLTTWVETLNAVGWVRMTAEEQMAYADMIDDVDQDTADATDELFWVAVDIVTERDLANR